MKVAAFGRFSLANERIGLIGKRKHQIWLKLARLLIRLYHRYSVKEMPCVYHKCGYSDRYKARARRKETDGDVLHRACVYKKAHKKRPYYAVSRALGNYTEAEAEKQISRKNRK